jgi:hypothetical protein
MRIPKPDIANALLLAGAITLIFAFNVVVDPFQANDWVDLGLDKRSVCFRLSYQDWKLAKYRAAPTPAIILGDSRMLHVNPEYVSTFTHKDTYNLAYGGGSMGDMVSTYWFARQQGPLESVYMGLNLVLLNDAKRYDRASQVVERLDNPIRYNFSPFISQASAKVLLFNLNLGAATSEKPPMSREEFWDFQLQTTASRNYRGFEYPKFLLGELKRIAADCKVQGTELILVIPPTHASLQARINDLGLSDEYDLIKQDLRTIAPVYDFDFDNEFTRDSSRFKDPYHVEKTLINGLIDEWAGGQRRYARVSTPGGP